MTATRVYLKVDSLEGGGFHGDPLVELLADLGQVLQHPEGFAEHPPLLPLPLLGAVELNESSYTSVPHIRV